MARHSYLCMLISLCLAVSLGGINALPPQAAAIIVTTTSDGVTPGGCTPAYCTLRDAVILANSTPDADVINFVVVVGDPVAG